MAADQIGGGTADAQGLVEPAGEGFCLLLAASITTGRACGGTARSPSSSFNSSNSYCYPPQHAHAPGKRMSYRLRRAVEPNCNSPTLFGLKSELISKPCSAAVLGNNSKALQCHMASSGAQRLAYSFERHCVCQVTWSNHWRHAIVAPCDVLVAQFRRSSQHPRPNNNFRISRVSLWLTLEIHTATPRR
jgi:hypothetical protein